jgi:hypothetical protein
MASRGRKEAKKDKDKGKDKKFAWEGKKKVDKNAESAAQRTIFIALAAIVLLIACAVAAAVVFAPDHQDQEKGSAAVGAAEVAAGAAAATAAAAAAAGGASIAAASSDARATAAADGSTSAETAETASDVVAASSSATSDTENLLVSALCGGVLLFAATLAARLRTARSSVEGTKKETVGQRQRRQRAIDAAKASASTTAADVERRAAEQAADRARAAAREATREAEGARCLAAARAAGAEQKAAFVVRKRAAYERRRQLRERGLLPSAEEMAAAEERLREEESGAYKPVLAAAPAFGTPGAGGGSGGGGAAAGHVWTAAESEALEQALMRYPPSYSHSDRERWAAIASCVADLTRDLSRGEEEGKGKQGGHKAPGARVCLARWSAVRAGIDAAHRAKKRAAALAKQATKERAREVQKAQKAKGGKAASKRAVAAVVAAAEAAGDGGGGGGDDDDGFDFDSVDMFEEPGRHGSSSSDDDGGGGGDGGGNEGEEGDEQRTGMVTEAERGEELWGFDGGGGGGSGGGGGGAAAAAAERMRPELSPAHHGTRIGVPMAVYAGVGTLTPERLHVELACVRCGTAWDPALSGADAAAASCSAWCGKCSALLKAQLVPCLHHAGSSTLCYLELTRCELLDVLPSAVLATCASCSHGNVLGPPRQGLARGEAVEHNCFQCHAKMKMVPADIEIELVTPSAGAEREKSGRAKQKGGSGSSSAAADSLEADDLDSELQRWRKKAKGDKTQAAVKLGSQLPMKGACRHFSKSFRWLRFPCCGRAYPCPACHESSGCPAVAAVARGDGEVGANQALCRAKRMLCGQCSLEQVSGLLPAAWVRPLPPAPRTRPAYLSHSPLTLFPRWLARERRKPVSEKCKGCGFKCTPGFSAHWEGGSGVRSTQTMSNKESKKFKGGQKQDGEKRKTSSKKLQRVGQAGKNKSAKD